MWRGLTNSSKSFCIRSWYVELQHVTKTLPYATQHFLWCTLKTELIPLSPDAGILCPAALNCAAQLYFLHVYSLCSVQAVRSGLYKNIVTRLHLLCPSLPCLLSWPGGPEGRGQSTAGGMNRDFSCFLIHTKIQQTWLLPAGFLERYDNCALKYAFKITS